MQYFRDTLREVGIDAIYKYKILILHLLFSNTPKYSDYVFKKRILMDQIETKLDQGLDRSISAVIGWVKVYLQYEQKKTDYKPETDVDTISSAVRVICDFRLSRINLLLILSRPACKWCKVCSP